MSKPQILVVDDDADLRMLIAMVLESEGFLVHEAENGLQALEQTRRQRFAVILLDMRMPVMDGTAFCAALRAEDRSPPPIIVITAAADPAQRAAEVCADAWIAKPFARGALVAVVRRFAPQPQAAHP